MAHTPSCISRATQKVLNLVTTHHDVTPLLQKWVTKPVLDGLADGMSLGCFHFDMKPSAFAYAGTRRARLKAAAKRDFDCIQAACNGGLFRQGKFWMKVSASFVLVYDPVVKKPQYRYIVEFQLMSDNTPQNEFTAR